MGLLEEVEGIYGGGVGGVGGGVGGGWFFFSSRRRHTRYIGDWSSDVCSSDLGMKKSGKPARCQIALGRKPASVDKTVYLMVSTNQNPSGNMFKVG